MRRRVDRSGAVVFEHSKAELEQAKQNKEAKSTRKAMKALMKLTGVSEEDLAKAMAEMEGE